MQSATDPGPDEGRHPSPRDDESDEGIMRIAFGPTAHLLVDYDCCNGERMLLLLVVLVLLLVLLLVVVVFVARRLMLPLLLRIGNGQQRQHLPIATRGQMHLHVRVGRHRGHQLPGDRGDPRLHRVHNESLMDIQRSKGTTTTRKQWNRAQSDQIIRTGGSATAL